MHFARTRDKGGFTLIELLVVIAIIGILVTMLLPAIQASRMAALKVRCAGNLRQIGVALYSYHAEHEVYPQGVDYTYPYQYWSWMAQLMPYVEQAPLAREAYLWATGTGYDCWWPWGDYWDNPPQTPPNPAFGTIVALFHCPANSRWTCPGSADGLQGTIVFTDYLGVSSGTSADFSTNDDSGIFFWTSSVTADSISDGASQTIMVGERPTSADGVYGWWFAGSGYDDSGTGDVVLGAREYAYAAAFGCPPNVGLQPGEITNQCDMVHFWSLHNGGANFLFADGSVHFLPYSANNTLPQLATRNRGDTPIFGSWW